MKNLGSKRASSISILPAPAPHTPALDLIGSLNYQNTNIIQVEFEEPIIGIAAGQYLAFFDGDELLGSGKIYCDHLSQFS